MNSTIKKALKTICLDRVAIEIREAYHQLLNKISRGFGLSDRQAIDRYFSAIPSGKLHIGCGSHLLEGWLNTDLLPRSERVVTLDAIGLYPFPDESFDYVFSEHTIEHITYEQGLMMLTECLRVLRPGGKVRISTPNIQFLIDMYAEGESERFLEYRKWAAARFIPYTEEHSALFVVNNFFRNWGHQFIYDREGLKDLMKKAGFTQLSFCSPKESKDPALQNLENETRMPEGFYHLETMCIEGTKPD